MRRQRQGVLVLAAVVGLVILIVTLAVAAWFYKLHVLDERGEHLQREAILEVIAMESPVLYSDGETPIGVFFAREHRVYVPYADIPEAWVQAIVAAEDQRYWDHPGVDLKGIARAMWQNVKARSVVAGGSSLTQQTAKNLYYRPDRSLRSKLEELLNALRLEAHYSKQDILEFYANQFHVSSNGRGLGIAARYFFDKQPSELDVQECAFLAGLVKAPARYNPFIGNEDQRERNIARAQARTAYVLGRMLAEGALDRATHDRLVARPLAFDRGTFRYDSSILLDEVERRLSLSPFPELFEAAGIDNPSTAGIRVVTTVDVTAQAAATHGLWHHLTEVGGWLEGVRAEDFVTAGPVTTTAGPPRPLSFRVARVTGRSDDGVRLDLGGHDGLLDGDAVERVASTLTRARLENRYARTAAEDREALSKALEPGAHVWVSVRTDSGEAPYLCDLEHRPELQGAALALDQGRIRAMVGGNDNRNFNRAVTARRQLGSTWKTLVLHAALQLGWTPTDTLDNRRGVFPFEGTWYHPRPDHQSKPYVSLAWAGVRSENLATIWLLYHLTDRLNDEQVRRLAELTGLARRHGEPRTAWIERIRDTHGVIATPSRLEPGHLNAVREEVVAGLAFSGHPEDAIEVRSLHHGLGFASERQRVVQGSGGSERMHRLGAVDHNLLHYRELLEACDARIGALQEALDADDDAPLFGLPDERAPLPVDGLSGRVLGVQVRLGCGRLAEGWVPLGELDVDLSRVLLDADALLDGRLHASTVRAIDDAMAARAEATRLFEPYDEELLYWHPDFRTMLSLRYLAGLAKAYGVTGELPPVLSMPLGALDVSLEEAAGLYQGMTTGKEWSFPGVRFEEGEAPGVRSREPVLPPESHTLLIAEIRDRDGNVLYRAEPKAERLADEQPARLVADVLENVVEHGTGRRARGLLGTWPVGGKTGTTNDYKNAAFLGVVPRIGSDGAPGQQLVVAAYVGYDDNRSMRVGRTRLEGASGALPVWMGAVRGLGDAGLLGDLSAAELQESEGRVAVMAESGLPLADLAGDELAAAVGERSVLTAPRIFAPFRTPASGVEGGEELPPAAVAPSTAEPELAPSIWDGIQ